MLPKGFKSPFAVPEKMDDLQDIMKAVDILGEYYHEQLKLIIMGFRDEGYLSPLGIENMSRIQDMKYTDVPENNRKIIRDHGSILLMQDMEAMVKRG